MFRQQCLLADPNLVLSEGAGIIKVGENTEMPSMEAELFIKNNNCSHR